MSTEEIQILLNRYFDNELNKSEEVFLFSQLSENEEARELFKNLNVLREGVQSTLENVPSALEEKILNSIVTYADEPKRFRFNVPTIVGYAFSVVLLIVSFLIYSQSMEYKKDIELSIQQINQQNKMIEMLFHSLPETEVRTTLSNDIVIKPSI